MKIAITNSADSYAEKMKDVSGSFAANYLQFVRNLFMEVGVKQDFLLDWDFGIGIESDDTDFEADYQVFDVSDYIGYLVLEYQRDLKTKIESLSALAPMEQK